MVDDCQDPSMQAPFRQRRRRPDSAPVEPVDRQAAISLADYRSYRDDFSKDYLARIGFDTRNDFVYPDLAFSLKPEVRGSRSRMRAPA